MNARPVHARDGRFVVGGLARGDPVDDREHLITGRAEVKRALQDADMRLDPHEDDLFFAEAREAVAELRDAQT